MGEAAAKSLYERLGGVYAIAAVINDLINRIMDNPRLNANPKVDEAHHRVQGGVQIPRYRDGLLGDGRSTAVFRAFHA